MTDDKDVSAGPPPSVDVQDPLPESNFFYRRVFSYLITVSITGLLAFVVWRIDGADELRQVALYLCLLLFVVVTYYMIAPSAEQVVKMLQTAKMFTHGVTTRVESRAEGPRGSARSTTTVGRHAAPRSPDRGPSHDAAPTSSRRRD